MTPLLDDLGRDFADLQHFGTHRVVGYQAWSRQLNGRLARSFVYLGERGEVLRDFGEADPAELNIRKLAEVTWNRLPERLRGRRIRILVEAAEKDGSMTFTVDFPDGMRPSPELILAHSF